MMWLEFLNNKYGFDTEFYEIETDPQKIFKKLRKMMDIFLDYIEFQA